MHCGCSGLTALLPVSSGLCALSINNDNCYLAYPGSATIGEVQVFDTINLVRFPEALGHARPWMSRAMLVPVSCPGAGWRNLSHPGHFPGPPPPQTRWA